MFARGVYMTTNLWIPGVAFEKRSRSKCLDSGHTAGNTNIFYMNVFKKLINTRGDQKVRGKVLLNRIAFIDCNENA